MTPEMTQERQSEDLAAIRQAALDYETATPESIAEAIAQEIACPVTYRDVETDGAAREAALIAELL